ncbi:hypothetical protein [Haloarchaeobius sp. HRN-SO-5]|uniref:hypothetical protein n=1 Tax=Haloarchaeobius sp. HRN-SO-5 TaxID=3446118 RepID=UPI003EBB77A2
MHAPQFIYVGLVWVGLGYLFMRRPESMYVVRNFADFALAEEEPELSDSGVALYQAIGFAFASAGVTMLVYALGVHTVGVRRLAAAGVAGIVVAVTLVRSDVGTVLPGGRAVAEYVAIGCGIVALGTIGAVLVVLV